MGTLDAEEDDDAWWNEPTATAVVHLDVPADAATTVEVLFVDEEPTGFLPVGDPRVLGDCRALAWWGWDPLERPAEADPDSPVVQVEAGRARADVLVEDVPIGRPLWACLTSWDGWTCRHPTGYPPQVVAVAPIAHEDEVLRLEFTLSCHGGIVGRVVGTEVEEDDVESWLEEEPAEPPRPFLHGLDVRLRGDGPAARCREDGLWQLASLRAGRHDLDVVAWTSSGMQRRVLSASVADDATTDVGTWVLEHEDPTWILRARDEDGSPLEGTFVIELAGWPPVEESVGEEGEARLAGRWSECTRIRFVPRNEEHLEPAEADARGLRGRVVELACRRREAALTRVYLKTLFPDGRHSFTEPSWACLRAASVPSWRPAFLGCTTGGCVGYPSDLLAPGPVEVVAWLPWRGLACRGPLEVPRAGGRRAFEVVELRFEDPGTLVRGRLEVTCAGVAADEEVQLLPAPRGAPAAELEAIRSLLVAGPFDARDRNRPHPVRIEPGPFELRGLPPGIDLDLVFLDDERVERARLPLRLERGQQLDLGRVQVELR